MRYEVTLLYSDGRMDISYLDAWPTSDEVEGFLLPKLSVMRMFFVHEWQPAGTKDKLPRLTWQRKPARVWGVHPGAMSPVPRVNEVASEIAGRDDTYPTTGIGNGGKVLGPVLIATLLQMQ